MIGSVKLTVSSAKISKEKNTEAWYKFVQGQSCSGVTHFLYVTFSLPFFVKYQLFTVDKNVNDQGWVGGGGGGHLLDKGHALERGTHSFLHAY